jgi:hypothetical protein
MNLDVFVHYIYDNNGDNDYNGKIIILKDDINLIKLQIYLCKMINNCYMFNNYYDKYYDNIIYQIYNNKIFGIIKQNNNIFYIWKIKI